MKNEYGIKLDRNGYAPSIMDWPQDRCFVCMSYGDLVRHEVFHGSLYRKKSKQYGCWLRLCPDCHHRLHNTDPDLDKYLKKVMQKKAMDHYGWSFDEFRQRFGKNYLEDT